MAQHKSDFKLSFSADIRSYCLTTFTSRLLASVKLDKYIHVYDDIATYLKLY